MDWIQVIDQAHADYLMEQFGEFHDGCLHELHLWTGYSVSPERSMTCTLGCEIGVRVLIQRQSDELSAIELLFQEVKRLNIVGPVNRDSIIYGATLLLRDGTIYGCLKVIGFPSRLPMQSHSSQPSEWLGVTPVSGWADHPPILEWATAPTRRDNRQALTRGEGSSGVSLSEATTRIPSSSRPEATRGVLPSLARPYAQTLHALRRCLSAEARWARRRNRRTKGLRLGENGGVWPRERWKTPHRA